VSERRQKPEIGTTSPWLRRADQAAVAVIVLVALGEIASYWLTQGGRPRPFD